MLTPDGLRRLIKLKKIIFSTCLLSRKNAPHFTEYRPPVFVAQAQIRRSSNMVARACAENFIVWENFFLTGRKGLLR